MSTNNNNIESMPPIDMSKYDRLIRTYGLSAAQKIQTSCVYIIGLKRGFAGEICKNLALSGINTIYLVGDDTINQLDIKSSMYYKKEGDKCGLVLQEAIKELNSRVSVYSIDQLDILMPNSVVVSINQSINRTIEINNMCRLNNCKLVYLLSSGLAGSVFVDCIEHTVMDATGELHEPIQVKDIVIKDGILTIHCNSHNLSEGDVVRFSMVQGTSTDFLQATDWTIIDSNNHSFKIVPNDKKNVIPSDFKFINGVADYILQPTTFIHKPLSEHLVNLDSTMYDLNNLKIGKNISKLSSPIPNEYIYTADLVFEPVTSLMSGFTSNEVIKLISHKYTPINQVMTWSDFNILGDVYSTKELVLDAYNNLMSRMKELNILVVGCGALGGEWLKNMAMLGCGEKGSIDIVDPDHIENSNLSRQFLFRPCHVKKSKCQVAKEMIRGINPNMNITTYEHKLSNENTLLTETVFRNKDIVINCLDNIEARRYVDKICFEKTLPLFESGTMGMKGNTMPIIPYTTETYSNMSDPPEEKQFPVCTIKNFPNQIVHTIHWARDNFELFNRGPINCNRFITNKEYLDELSLVEKNQAIEDIKYFLSNQPTNWEDCILKAKDSFEINFNHSIKQLLHCFPKDHMLDSNTLFWSHGKICPEPLEISHQETIKYILAFSKLLCRVYGILANYDISAVESIIETRPQLFKMKEFVSNDKIKIAKDDSELASIETISNDLNGLILDPTHINLLNPQEFEKDDPTNWHIEYITSASNCRALNYGIKPATEYETKGIAGRIIPAVATTTATVVGLIGMELLRYVAGHKKCSDYRSWFMNMADNMIVSSEPIEMPPINIGKTKMNGWTKFTYNPMKLGHTLKELIEYYTKQFNTTIYMILYGSAILYSDFTDSSVDSNIVDIFKETYDVDITQDKTVLTLISEDNDIEFPPVILYFE
jgi:ubiquitin-activating enzyme E1